MEHARVQAGRIQGLVAGRVNRIALLACRERRLAEQWGHICGASKVHIVHTHARSAHHLEAASRSLKDLLCHLPRRRAVSYPVTRLAQPWPRLIFTGVIMLSGTLGRCDSNSCCAGE